MTRPVAYHPSQFIPTRDALDSIGGCIKSLKETVKQLKDRVDPPLWNRMNVAARKILCRPSGDMEPIQVPEELKAAIVGIYEAIKGSVKIFDPICKTYRSEVERLQKDPRDIRLSPEGNHCTLEWHVHLAERLVRYLLTPTEAPSCYPPRGHADYKEGSALSLHDSRHPEVKAGLERTRSCAYKLVETIDTVRCQHNISSIRSSPDYWIELDRQRQAEEASTLGNYYDAHRA